MLNENARDLINRAIDGELSESEGTEFRALLAESDEARQFHEELAALDGLLKSSPKVEPPGDLESRILRRVQLPRPRRWFTSVAGWMQGNPVPYGAAAAAGVLATVLFYEIGPGPTGASDYSNLVGTLVRGNGVEGVVQLSFLNIDLPAVRGKVLLSGSGDLKLLRFNVDSRDPIDFEVGLAGSGLTFGGFAQVEGDNSESLDYESGSFKVSNSGHQEFTVILRDSPDQQGASGGIVVSVSQAGEALYQGVLSL